ncbi:5-hydroxytryptamine receptor 1D-like [Argopecten irradians]|uniref:5-hydroxytryptamine receptor 1D-like n=1 Tax=Argopecten irradians TaxID=31199 RepID=UPI003717B5E3
MEASTGNMSRMTSSVEQVTSYNMTSFNTVTVTFIPTTHSNVSDDQEEMFISNSEMAQKLLPVTLYVYVLMCFGLIGNSVVVYVYLFTWKSTTVKYFIGYLATLDLITSGVCMPLDIVMLTNPITTNSSALCRILRFSRAVTSIAEGFMLVVIAVDRYLRVCKYKKKQISNTTAKKLCFVSVPVSLSLSWPALFVFGNFDRSSDPILQTSCSTVQHLRGTFYPHLYYIMMCLIFVIVSVSLFVLYISVGVKLCRLRPDSKLSASKAMAEHFRQAQLDFSTDGSRSSTLRGEDRNTRKAIARKSSFVDLSKVSVNLNSMRKRSTRIMKRQKTSLTLFLITAVEFISFLPYVTLVVCVSVIPNFQDGMSEPQQVWYNIGLLSYFLGNALNPLIYGFFSGNFRRKCMEILQSVKNGKKDPPSCISFDVDNRVSTLK